MDVGVFCLTCKVKTHSSYSVDMIPSLHLGSQEGRPLGLSISPAARRATASEDAEGLEAPQVGRRWWPFGRSESKRKNLLAADHGADAGRAMTAAEEARARLSR